MGLKRGESKEGKLSACGEGGSEQPEGKNNSSSRREREKVGRTTGIEGKSCTSGEGRDWVSKKRGGQRGGVKVSGGIAKGRRKEVRAKPAPLAWARRSRKGGTLA